MDRHSQYGIDSPCKPPEAAELRIETTTLMVDEAADLIVPMRVERGAIDRAVLA